MKENNRNDAVTDAAGKDGFLSDYVFFENGRYKHQRQYQKTLLILLLVLTG